MRIKKLSAFVLALTLFVSVFTVGCQKNEAQEENTTTTSTATSTTTETTETTAAATTTAPATTTTGTSASSVSSAAKANKAKIIKTALTAKDKKNLSSFLANFIDSGSDSLPEGKKEMNEKTGIYYNLKYSYKTADAIDIAFAAAFDVSDGVSLYTIFDEIARECGWIKYYEFLGNNVDYFIRAYSERDPQKKLEEAEGLIKVKADKLDEILETVFNVKPNRSYKLFDYKDGDKKLAGYYDNGWFYISYGAGGDCAGPLVKLKSVDKQPDGKYIVKAEYLYGNDDEGYDHIANFKAEVALKDYHGDRIWSIYSMEKL